MWKRWLSLTLILAITLSGVGGRVEARSYDESKVDPGLLRQALADPEADYDVIVRSVPDQKKTKAQRDDRGRRAGDEVQKAGGKPKHVLGIVGGASATLSGKALLDLSNSSAVDYVFADVKFTAQWDPVADAANATSPGLLSINAPQAWTQYNVTGRGIGVAVVDSGVAAHPDLGDRIVAAIDFTQAAPTVSASPLGDPGGHGTHVAGLVAGDGTSSGGAITGVAPGANIIDVRVIDANGSSNTSVVLRGLQWILRNKSTYNVKVVNLSLGAPVTKSYKLDPLATAVEVLTFAGVTILVSAGNSGSAGGTITSPANDPFVISVGAIDDAQTAATLDDTIASFSSRGRTAYDSLTKPDVSAPGRRMVSLRSPGSTLDTQYPERRVDGTDGGPGYFTLSGTSMAAPVVAGTVALMLERNPTLAPNQIKKRLKSGASDVSGLSVQAQGAGRIDVAATLGAIGTDREYGAGRVSDSFAKDMRRFIEGQPLVWKDLGYNGGVDSHNVTWEGITWENITWDNVTWENISWENLTWEGITWENITWEGITWESVDDLNIGALSGTSSWAKLD